MSEVTLDRIYADRMWQRSIEAALAVVEDDLAELRQFINENSCGAHQPAKLVVPRRIYHQLALVRDLSQRRKEDTGYGFYAEELVMMGIPVEPHEAECFLAHMPDDYPEPILNWWEEDE